MRRATRKLLTVTIVKFMRGSSEFNLILFAFILCFLLFMGKIRSEGRRTRRKEEEEEKKKRELRMFLPCKSLGYYKHL